MTVALTEDQKLHARWYSGAARLAVASGWTTQETSWHFARVNQHASDLRRLKRLVQNGRRHAAFRLQDHILHSQSGRLCAFIDQYVLKAKSGKIRPLTVQQLDNRLASVRPDQQIFGSALVTSRKKADGKKRVIMSPDWKIRTAQRLVSRTLPCWNVQNDFDHNAPGRGTHTAVKEVIRQIKEEGITSFVLFDIKDFFSSVRPSHLKGRLPLPDRVMKHAVFFTRRALLVLANKLDMIEVEAARQCLPAGARLSGMIASSLLGWILHNLSGAKGLVTFVDDGLIGACDPAGANNLAEALKSRLSQHPGGPLYLKHLSVVDAHQGFPFLGYWIKIHSDTFVGTETVVVRPSHAAKNKMKRNLFRRLRVLGKSAGYDALVEVAHTYRVNWLSSFPLWNPSEEELFDLEGEVETYVVDYLDGYEGKQSLPKVKLAMIGVGILKPS